MTVAKIQPLRRPDTWEKPWRLRPRAEAAPRCLVEQLVQWAWRNAVLLYIAFAVTISIVLQLELAR